MDLNESLCIVEGLYDYTSNDPASLSFGQGEVIHVLAKLESGWWDGWCNGRRGWFPSNYVKELTVTDTRFIHSEYTSPDILEQESIHPSSLSRLDHTGSEEDDMVHRSHHDEVFLQQQQQTNKSNWILQTTEDGSEVYYYNVITKEMRYSLPAGFTTQLDCTTSSPNSPMMIPPSPTGHDTTTMNGNMDHAMYTMDNNNNNKIIDPHSTGLPPHWTRKVDTKGRVYFCNLMTDETTWNLDQIDPQTGNLNTTTTQQSPVFISATQLENQDNEQPLSWHQLSTLIAHAIHALKHSIKQSQTALLQRNVTIAVHRIRLMLYVSNTIDKESSPHLKCNKTLRVYHRALLASLAKTVLSTKAASGTWSEQDALHKLQMDTDQLLVDARNFLSVASQDLQLEIQNDKPRLMEGLLSTMHCRWRMNSGNTPDPSTTLIVLADNIRGAMSSFMSSAHDAFALLNEQAAAPTKLRTTAPLLVAQFRNLSNTASQFLNAIDDYLPSRQHDDSSRQAIYNAMGLLFIASQTITNTDLTLSMIKIIYRRLEDCIYEIEKNVQAICLDVNNKQTEQQQQQQQTSDLFDGDDDDDILSSDYHPATTTKYPPSSSTTATTTTTTTTTTTSNSHPSADGDSSYNPMYSSNNNIIEEQQVLLSPTTTTTTTPNDKLAKFFGEDTLLAARRRDTIIGSTPTASKMMGSVATFTTATTGISPSLTTTEVSTPTTQKPTTFDKPDYLGADYKQNEIIFNMEGNVKGGTVLALVQRLTQHDQLDPKFSTTFLLTYRSFCTTEELFEALFARYTLQTPMDLTDEELDTWNENKLKLVRLRVSNVIKSWLDSYYIEQDRVMLPALLRFSETVIRESMQFGAEQLGKAIQKRMDTATTSELRKMTLNVRTNDIPPPILPKNMKRLRFLEIDPLELARQLTIMDSKLYSRIKPVECLDKNWGKKTANAAENVKASIEYSNQVTAWVTDSILCKEELKKRSAVVKHWIYVAEKCRLLHNYNTCMAILSAFDNSSVGRLKRTWETMSARTMAILTGIRRLMGANRNFTEYRDIIHKVNPPCIPFLGIYLQDLTFIEDGNSNFLKKTNNHLINFDKRTKTAEVIRELQQYQSTPYILQQVPDIQDFIINHLRSSRDDETLYNLSLAVEPRERSEDTISRRLKESGL
ncbi:ras guanine nucleotide exchange factor domain-containing protein [Chlamydoabsidia padenii]|nr:ras guanine nucleotide exchange factor domain-containing protein [Chlamydoabsidia padenii]